MISVRAVAAVLVTAALWVHPVLAVDIIGMGTASCGAWTEARTRKVANIYEQWMVGYLSGAAAVLSKDLLAKRDAFGIWRWVDNYCVAHPLDQLATAGVRLFLVLEERQ